MSDVSVKNVIEGKAYTSVELVAALKLVGLNYTLESLVRLSRSENYGLASDGLWYTAEENVEVDEACRTNSPTFLAAQYLRNR
jgi:hypothetical protein